MADRMRALSEFTFACAVLSCLPLPVCLQIHDLFGPTWDVGVHIAEALVRRRPPCSERRQAGAQVEVIRKRGGVPRRGPFIAPRQHRVRDVVRLLPQGELRPAQAAGVSLPACRRLAAALLWARNQAA